jgi:hypothetical protein
MAMVPRRAPKQADLVEITNVDVEPESASTEEFDRPDFLETDSEVSPLVVYGEGQFDAMTNISLD